MYGERGDRGRGRGHGGGKYARPGLSFCSFPGELERPGRGGADVGMREPGIMDQRWTATRRNGGGGCQ